MCEPNFVVNKIEETLSNPSCSHNEVNANPAMIEQKNPECNNIVSLKQEPDHQNDLTLNIQTANHWIRDVVDPSFNLKPMDFGLKPVPIFYENKVAATALIYQVPLHLQGLAPAAEKTKKKVEERQNGHNVTNSPQPNAAPGLYYCEMCNRKFTRQSNLTEHMLRHLGKVYTCQVCHKKFSCLRYLSRHTRIHSGEPTLRKSELVPRSKNADKSYLCNLCDKKFSCKSHLVAHTRIHTGEKPFCCQICSKTFNHKSHLTAHIRIHTGEKPFQCRICQKQFRDPSNLAGHMRVHNGQKPFACQVCDEQFSHRSHLKKHERVHTDNATVPFTQCDKRLSDDSKLKSILKTQANKSTCGFCNNQFTSKKGQEKTVACDVCTREFGERMHMRIQERSNEERSFMIYAVGDQ